MSQLSQVKLLLQGKFPSADALRTHITSELQRLRIPRPKEILFWQFLSHGKLVCGIHIDLVVDGARYHFERKSNGLSVIELDGTDSKTEVA